MTLFHPSKSKMFASDIMQSKIRNARSAHTSTI